MAAFRTGDGHLPDRTVPVKDGHVQAEVWWKETGKWTCFSGALMRLKQRDFLKMGLLSVL